MSTELIVPTLGESITEATVSKWLKNIGDNFEADEPLVEIETDKITVEVPAPHAGSLKEIKYYYIFTEEHMLLAIPNLIIL